MEPDKTGQKLENPQIRDEKGRFINGHPDIAGNSKRGRPRKAFHELIDNVVSEEEWEKVLRKALAQAKKGNDPARKFLAEHRFGKPVQRTELTGAEGAAIQFEDAVKALQQAEQRLKAQKQAKEQELARLIDGDTNPKRYT